MGRSTRRFFNGSDDSPRLTNLRLTGVTRNL